MTDRNPPGTLPEDVPAAGGAETPWRALVTSALLGTERQRPALPAAGPLAAPLAGLRDAEPARALLGAAALLAPYRRAGWRAPVDDRPLPVPAPADSRPACPDRAAGHLAAMLAGQYPEILPEWLAAADRRGLRAPESALPDLLQLGAGRADLQVAVWRILGGRGRWLAGQNPAWDWAADVDPDTTWQTAHRTARLALLRRLRGTEPARARDLLTATWSQERPDDRAAFLGIFVDGLDMADEPLLEAALDDRRAEVRRSAADLLVRLPDSRLVARMTARAEGWLTLSARRSGVMARLRGDAFGLTVRLPEDCDAAMQRDGVDPNRHDGFGPRAGWLSQVIAAVPPTHWSARWGATPAELVASAQGDFSGPLLAGWCAATARHQDPAWAEAIFAVRDTAGLGGVVDSLIDLMPDARRDPIVIELQTSHPEPLVGRHPVLALLRYCQRPWSRMLTRAVLAHIGLYAHRGDHAQDWGLAPTFHAVALAMEPVSAEAATAGWPQPDALAEPVGAAVDGLLARLDFRAAMHDALAETARSRPEETRA